MPHSAPSAAETQPSAGEFYARAEALQPILREQAADAEHARSVPADSIQAFRDAGLVRMTQPERYGGNAMGWDVLCGVAQRLTRCVNAGDWRKLSWTR